MYLLRRLSLFKSAIRCLSSEVNVVSSKAKQIQIPKIPLHEYMWKNLDKFPDKIAAVCFETQRSYTFSQMYKKSLSLTKFLKDSIKLRKSDTVGVVLPNLPEYPIVLLGAVQAGLRVTTCNPAYTAEEIRKQLENSEAKLIFTSRNLLPLVRQAINGINQKIPIIEITEEDGFSNDTISFKEISSRDGCQPLNLDSTETIFLPYSSGTTGLPKGVQLNHFNIVANLLQIASPEFNLIDPGAEVQEIVPAFLPFFHIYGLVVILFHCLAMGSRLVTMPKFSSENFIKLLHNYKPTILYGVPSVVIMANTNPNIKSEDLLCIKTLMSGAAPLGASDVEQFLIKTKNKVNLIQGYGMTETSPVTIKQTPNLPNGIKIGGSGFLLPNTEAKIIPLDGSSTVGLDPNQSGELLIRGPQVMQGYYKNPQATEEILLDDGWIKTGDIASYDEDGHFFITDRLKELIKVKGFQVAPAELEEVIRTHPSVEDVAVVGVPHVVQGEAPKAFVVLKGGESVKKESLQEFVAGKVAKHKHLAGGVVFVDSIPKNASGKILRRELSKL